MALRAMDRYGPVVGRHARRMHPALPLILGLSLSEAPLMDLGSERIAVEKKSDTAKEAPKRQARQMKRA
jgi:hypothetical protein